MGKNADLDIRTLCGKCAKAYVEAGYVLERITYVRHDKCDFCGFRAGTDYILLGKKHIKDVKKGCRTMKS